MSNDDVRDIPIGELLPFVHQSREVFDEAELRSLSEDIKANGQLQAGVGWFDPGRGKYVLICGERRMRALVMAGRPTMAVKVLTGQLTLGDMLTINLSENLNRQNLNILERAKSFQRLAQLEGLTAKQVAERMHVSDATVSRDLAILDLPEVLQTQFGNGTLPGSIAAELRRIGDTQVQLELLPRPSLLAAHDAGPARRGGACPRGQEECAAQRVAAGGQAPGRVRDGDGGEAAHACNGDGGLRPHPSRDQKVAGGKQGTGTFGNPVTQPIPAGGGSPPPRPSLFDT